MWACWETRACTASRLPYPACPHGTPMAETLAFIPRIKGDPSGLPLPRPLVINSSTMATNCRMWSPRSHLLMYILCTYSIYMRTRPSLNLSRYVSGLQTSMVPSHGFDAVGELYKAESSASSSASWWPYPGRRDDDAMHLVLQPVFGLS